MRYTEQKQEQKKKKKKKRDVEKVLSASLLFCLSINLSTWLSICCACNVVSDEESEIASDVASEG